ncbi:hypothetical protein [Demequina litorisediminis]|uniref:Extracellular solute-binding protein n=1 Tax=Demequina litorisediminis TaxID=1849022 RepID=A0ABQ6IJJ4_9MICO|nr:hypothetical protein [Demequina litorisediminis]GMA37276.1 hypothetical protein GCM10025876_34800 [Demequina litorisediminis]
MDPESTTQNYDTLFSKFQNGQVLFSWWPWLGQSAYNTEGNTEAGKGFMIAPMDDMNVFSYGAEAYGGKQVLAIGSQAEDPERIAAFIDWLYSPDGTYMNNSQTMGAAGPEGLTWEMGTNGEPQADRLWPGSVPVRRRPGPRGLGRRQLHRRHVRTERVRGPAERHRPGDGLPVRLQVLAVVPGGSPRRRCSRTGPRRWTTRRAPWST